MKRLLGLPAALRARSRVSGVSNLNPATVEEIKAHLLNALHDCESPASARIRYRVERCVTATELWLMRSDIFQEVSSQHSQTEASSRVNQLLPHFRGWVPSSQLSKVR